MVTNRLVKTFQWGLFFLQYVYNIIVNGIKIRDFK